MSKSGWARWDGGGVDATDWWLAADNGGGRMPTTSLVRTTACTTLDVWMDVWKYVWKDADGAQVEAVQLGTRGMEQRAAHVRGTALELRGSGPPPNTNKIAEAVASSDRCVPLPATLQMPRTRQIREAAMTPVAYIST
jgi:hypothetical protein